MHTNIHSHTCTHIQTCTKGQKLSDTHYLCHLGSHNASTTLYKTIELWTIFSTFLFIFQTRKGCYIHTEDEDVTKELVLHYYPSQKRVNSQYYLPRYKGNID